MITVRRFDRGELKAAHKTDEGYVYAEGYATRAGVFLYKDREGNVTRELRPPEEVGSVESLASLARKPITDLHPDEFVDADNIEKHGVGQVDPEVVFEKDYADGFVKVKMTVSRASAVKSVEDGRQELSCGYEASLDETPGVWTDAQGTEHRYDAIQRNIRYNHLALVDKGRAGAHARLRLDSDAMRVDAQPEPNTESTMPSINENASVVIGGKTYRLDEYPALQRAILDEEKRNDGLAEELAEMAKKVAEYEVKMADMEKEIADLKAEEDTQGGADAGEENPPMAEEEEEDGEHGMKEEDKQDRLDFANERILLINFAQDLRLDGFDDPRQVTDSNADIKRAIVLTRFDESTLKSPIHVDAAFDLMVEATDENANERTDEGNASAGPSSSEKLADRLFAQREANRREDNGVQLDKAQGGYEDRMRSNLQ